VTALSAFSEAMRITLLSAVTAKYIKFFAYIFVAASGNLKAQATRIFDALINPKYLELNDGWQVGLRKQLIIN